MAEPMDPAAPRRSWKKMGTSETFEPVKSPTYARRLHARSRPKNRSPRHIPRVPSAFPRVVPWASRPKWAHATVRLCASSPRTLREFIASRAGHKDQAALKGTLEAWFDEVRKASWTSTADMKRRYPSASIVSAERIVFNIKGNDYRLVVAVDFEKGIVWIKWIGTHKEYDRIDVEEVDHETP